MENTREDKPKKKKGFFAILKESMAKTSEGCGPDCGCNVPEKDDKPKNGNSAKKVDKE